MARGGGDVKTSPNKMSKPRVGVLLRQVAAGQKPAHTPSEQVETLTHKYKDLCQNLKRLQKVFKERHVAMLETIQARDAVRINENREICKNKAGKIVNM
jgi:ribosomal protein S17